MGIPSHGVFAVMKKTRRVALVLALALALGTALYALGPGRGGEKRAVAGADSKKSARIQAELIAAVAKDSDGDGLKDWEEAIWRTDPAKADSDGDGTPDGEEVAQNRDPAKAGPNDRHAISAGNGKDNAAGAELEKNLTARIGTRLSAEVVAGAAQGREPDLEALAGTYARDLGGTKVLDGAKRFSKADITPAKENDLLAVVKFFAAVEEVWAKHFAAGQPSDLEVFFAAFEKDGGAGAAAALAPYERGYAAAIAAVRKAPAPQDLETFAVAFLNYLSKTRRSTELMQNFTADPLSAALAVQERLALNEEFSAFMKKSASESKSLVEKKVAELTAAQKQP